MTEHNNTHSSNDQDTENQVQDRQCHSCGQKYKMPVSNCMLSCNGTVTEVTKQ